VVSWKQYELIIKHKLRSGVVLNVPIRRKARSEEEAVKEVWKRLRNYPKSFSVVLSVYVVRELPK